VVSVDTPLNIPDNNIDGAVSSITVTDDIVIEKLSVSVGITHTWVADLTLTLISPAGKEIELIGGACSGNDDIDATFTDSGSIVSCSTSPPAISGDIVPTTSLYHLNGDSSAGVWKLRVVDNGVQDVGILNSWSLNICSSEEVLGVPAEKLKGFKIYPNPAEKTVFIDFESDTSGSVAIAMYDVLGRRVFSKELAAVPGNFSTRLDLGRLKSGIYLIRVLQGRRISTSKIVLR
jgi:subtilisin-like proprotein convertase family protein